MPLQIYYPPLQNPNDPNSPRIAPWGDWVAYGYSEDPIKIYRAELVSTQGNQYQEYLAVLLDMPNECTHAWAVFFQDVVPPISGYYTLKLTVAVFNPSCDTPVAPPQVISIPNIQIPNTSTAAAVTIKHPENNQSLRHEHFVAFGNVATPNELDAKLTNPAMQNLPVDVRKPKPNFWVARLAPVPASHRSPNPNQTIRFTISYKDGTNAEFVDVIIN